MKIKQFITPALLICSALALATRHNTKPAAAKAAGEKVCYDEIDAYVEAQRQRLKIPGAALAIVEGGRIAHLRGFGRERPEGEAPRAQTPFFIGSLTKSFTALAVMQLVEAEKIDLDAPVQAYLPWFRVADSQASAQMTVRHLLNHTSGLPVQPGMAGLSNFDSRPGAAERQVRALARLEITRRVGAQFEYSNTNYNVLGLIVEAASGEAYCDYVQKHIFDPLDMRHSYTSKAAAQQDGLAMGHRYWFGRPVPAPDLPVPTGSLASGQLISSAEDMAHYMIAQLNGGRYGEAQILSAAGIEAMQRGAAEVIEMGISFGHYGMGWISQGSGQSRIVSHDGIVPDFGGYMALAPEQKKGIVLLFNANHAMIKMTFEEVGLGAAQRLTGAPPTPTRFDALPWAMRGMALIPIAQIIGVATTLRLLRGWQRDPGSRPRGGRKWGVHVLLPLASNLTVAATLIPMMGEMRGFLRLFTPDYAWLATLSGGFALVWSALRSVLVVLFARGEEVSRG